MRAFGLVCDHRRTQEGRGHGAMPPFIPGVVVDYNGLGLLIVIAGTSVSFFDKKLR